MDSKKSFTLFCLSVLQPLICLCGEVKILAFAGSTRADSFNKKLVREAADLAQKMGAQVTLIDLKDFPMPLFDQDEETKQGMPEHAKRLRMHMKQADVIFISSPEYNASVPAVLKNAIDWASRSEQGGSAKGDVFKDKQFVLMSASPGKGGGKRAMAHLRTILEDIGATKVSSEISIPQAHLYFADKEKTENLALQQEIQQLIETKL
jgi:chromate reductase, NAD(P)H dehydrogenase (quinone)